MVRLGGMATIIYADRIEERQEENKDLGEEIIQTLAILKDSNVDVQIINEYTHLKESSVTYMVRYRDICAIYFSKQVIDAGNFRC